MIYKRISVEIIGSKAKQWEEIKDSIIQINFPEIFPGPGNKFTNRNNLFITFNETIDNKIFLYFSKWISGVTPIKDESTISIGKKTKKVKKFIVIEDSINSVFIRFYDDQDKELVSYLFNNVYPNKITTNEINYPEGSLERTIRFNADFDQ